MDEELKYEVAITLFHRVGPRRLNKIIEYYSSAENFFNDQSVPDELTILNIDNAQKNDALHKAEKEIEFCRKNNIKILHRDNDRNYPERLKYCPDAPYILYCLGDADLNAGKILSVVGTRKATPYGKEVCENIIKGLKERGHNVLISSGLAYGIDICSHRSALKYEMPTVGVVAHPLNTMYPAAHKNTANKMIHSGGAVISDFATTSKMDPKNFLKRNRIIAGMADATLVVESAPKGGSLITASLAGSYSRDVLAVPGRRYDEYSKGCNRLIKTNMASLVETAEDVEYVMGWEQENAEEECVREPELFPDLSDEEWKIFGIIKENVNISVNDLVNLSGLNVSKLSSLLLDMEIKDTVISMPGNKYVIKNQ